MNKLRQIPVKTWTDNIINRIIIAINQLIDGGGGGGGSVTIVDNLSSTSKTSALSANMGRVLNSNIVNKYIKPDGGIPKNDLSTEVQNSLNKAETALQEHQDISGKQNVIKEISFTELSENSEEISIKNDEDTEEYLNLSKEGLKVNAYFTYSGRNLVEDIDKALRGGDSADAAYFVEEQSKTITAIKNAKSESSMYCCYNILTDTHINPEGTSGTYGQLKQTFKNLKSVISRTATSGILMLGDYLNSNSYYWCSPYIINKEYDFHQEEALKLTNNVYMVIGNHDGLNGSIIDLTKDIITLNRKACERCYDSNHKPLPHFYFDNTTVKTRFLCLGMPYINNNKSDGWSVDTNMLNFIKTSLDSLENNWHVIILCHIHPYSGDLYENQGNNTLIKMLNAFANHTLYQDDNINVDYTTKTTNKLVAWICGHHHYDAVYDNKIYTSKIADFVDNEIGCKIIVIGKTGYSFATETIKSKNNINYGIVPARTANSLTQELWDTLIYQRDLNRIKLIRFGSSPSIGVGCDLDENGDRIINV